VKEIPWTSECPEERILPKEENSGFVWRYLEGATVVVEDVFQVQKVNVLDRTDAHYCC
jgi:hypothetical protein